MVKLAPSFLLLLSSLSFLVEAVPARKRKCPAKSPTTTIAIETETVVPVPTVTLPGDDIPEVPSTPTEEPSTTVTIPPVNEEPEVPEEPEIPEVIPTTTEAATTTIVVVPVEEPTQPPATTTTTTPVPEPSSNVCKNPIVRKEWSALTNAEKKAFLDAVVCLGKKAPKATQLKASKSRFDDFVAIHSKLTNKIHWVGSFLPWHRYYLHAYEKALREECGYTGAHPYWDELRDAESNKEMSQYDIFSPTTGFGGNGPYVAANGGAYGMADRSGGGCVPNGPFTYPNFSVAVNKGSDYMTPNPRCLKRDFCPTLFKTNVKREVFNEINSKTTFKEFTRRLEAVPGWGQKNIHAAGHYAVGGVLGNMGDVNNSPGDPVFYMHHANLDRLWAQWQGTNEKRIFDISGPKNAHDYNGPQTTLKDTITLEQLGETIPVEEVMHTRNNRLCYVYE